jgi:hypothetical protein
MRFTHVAAGLLASILACQPALAQGMVMVPTGGGNAKPVPHDPPADARDTPEEIAKDAARDLKDSRFYNKPGATRAQYDADWQECRLIARGSRTPTGTIPYYYNPAVVSPLAAGIGAGIGGAIGAAIVEGQQRRANRRSCLLIKGWRLVELEADAAAKIAKMTDDQKSAYFNTIVGADKVAGEITERTRFSLAPDPALRLDAPVSGPGTVFLGKKVDPAAPVKLAPGEAAIVLAYRRPDEGSAGRSGAVQFLRYDPAARDVVYQPRDWKKKNDKTTYSLVASSADRKAPLEVQVLRVTPGDYVIGSTSVGQAPMTRTFCFGAPTFHVAQGEVAYVGDFIPFMNVKLANGDPFADLVHTSHIEDTRRALAAKQPELAAALKPAPLRNRATFACAGITMDRWDLNGVEALPEPDPKPAEIAAVTTR